MNDNKLDFDALVIGAGAGGMCAAARLKRLGYRVLLVESQAIRGRQAVGHLARQILESNRVLFPRATGISDPQVSSSPCPKAHFHCTTYLGCLIVRVCVYVGPAHDVAVRDIAG